MFFVALLLNQTIGWMRSRPGTTSLRAILCMDEVFGYMPPVAEPPSKRPMLTLLKQARAFGLGLVLATQNPVDLDYKGLSNVGTWFLGRLQTDRDKQRLLDGLEGAAAGGAKFDRAGMEQTLAGLGNRVFLLHNVHEDGPVVFQSRWALSYLRGPLTRPEIKRLMDPRKGTAVPAAGTAAGKPAGAPAATPPPLPASAADGSAGAAPVLPPEVPQRFLPLRGRPEGAVYRPALYGAATLHFVDDKKGIDHAEEVALLAPLVDDGPDWYAAEAVELTRDDLEAEPAAGARFAALPDAAVRAKSYDAWRKQFEEALFRTRSCDLLRSPSLGVLGNPGESERDFRIRLTDQARQERDEQVAALRQKYAPKVVALQERLRRAEQNKQKQEAQASQQTWSTVVSAGSAVLGALFGRKTFSASNLSKAGTAMKSAGRTFQERQDVSQAAETIESVQKQIADLNAELEAETAALQERLDPQKEALETVSLKPRKKDVETRLVTLAWVPERGGAAAWK
jgi:phage host-nuclease inhibitor protein Gam